MNTLFDSQEDELLSLKGASVWAGRYIRKNVTESNISYLIQYGLISKLRNNGAVYVKKSELKSIMTPITKKGRATGGIN